MKDFILQILSMIGVICVINFLLWVICPYYKQSPMDIIVIGVLSYFISDKIEKI